MWKSPKDMAREIEKDLGKEARKEFHDLKEGADRTKAELKEHAQTVYERYGKTPPAWMQ